MATLDLQKIADDFFKRYRKVDKVFITTDGQPFTDENYAKTHAEINDVEVNTFRRSGTKDPKKEEAKEVSPEKKILSLEQKLKEAESKAKNAETRATNAEKKQKAAEGKIAASEDKVKSANARVKELEGELKKLEGEVTTLKKAKE